MKKQFDFIVLLIILIIYFYSIVFKAFPVSTKIFLEAIAALFCIKYASNKYFMKTEFKTILKFIVFFIIYDLVISFINGKSDYHIIKVMLPVVGSIFATELIITYQRKLNISIPQIFFLIICVILGESLIAAAMRLLPDLFFALNNYLVFDLGSEDRESVLDVTRVVGLGNAIYFGVLPTCCLGAVFCVYEMQYYRSALNKFFLFFSWLIISIVSFLSARWSLSVILVSVFYFFYCQRNQNIFKSIFTICLASLVAYYGIIYTMNNVDDQLQKWAFSFITDKSQDDGSLDLVIKWWLNTNVDGATLLFGDAQYVDPRGGYYKHVDIGIFRQIFYGGLPFLFGNILIHFKTLKYINHYARDYYIKGLIYSLIIGYIFILGKGDATMLSFFILLLGIFSKGVYQLKQ